MYVDTHCHLDDPRYSNVDDIVNAARLNNVNYLIVSGYDIDSSLRAIELSKKYNEIHATVGIHPTEVEKVDSDYLLKLEEMLKNSKVVGIGEIGLDYYHEGFDKDLQQKFFREQINLANQYKKPIVVHSRESISDTYDIISQYKDQNIKCILHCYASSVEMAEKFIKINTYFGIGGVVTYKNAKVLKEVVDKIELKYFVLETDAPYLSPEPFRGTLNEPSRIPIISQEISKIKETKESDVMATTTETAFAIFDLKV